MRGYLTSSPSRRDAAIVALGLLGTAAAIILDAAEIPVFTTVLVGVFLTALGIVIEKAISATDTTKKIRLLSTGLILSLLLPVGAWIYHVWLDAKSTGPGIFYVEGKPGHYFPAHVYPGGPALEDTPLNEDLGISTGQSYEFDCVSKDSKGRPWLKRDEAGNYWYATGDLRHVAGADVSDLPDC
ncbi:hypothetical protein ABT202_10015 [Streptomyces sp900105245]|uniref:hypothetical protein n=1 Tax=Streptomyces sp. 900105245 TaxID=3154379 RepID=UPI00332FD1BF